MGQNARRRQTVGYSSGGLASRSFAFNHSVINVKPTPSNRIELSKS